MWGRQGVVLLRVGTVMLVQLGTVPSQAKYTFGACFRLKKRGDII